jgi:hypothetical protein
MAKNNLSKHGTITSDPAMVNKVLAREGHVAYAIDRFAVPMDGITASAMLNMAMRIYQMSGQNEKWLSTMMREWADTLDLACAPAEGKPS